MRLFLLSILFYTPACIAANPDADKTQSPLITDPVGTGDFVQMFLGLALVLGVIFAMAWVIRRMGNIKTNLHGAIKIIAATTVGQRERILLVQVGQEQLLIGVAQGQVRKLHVLSNPIEQPQSQAGAAAFSFSQRLQQVLKGG